jgi:hypothetical protein
VIELGLKKKLRRECDKKEQEARIEALAPAIRTTRVGRTVKRTSKARNGA